MRSLCLLLVASVLTLSSGQTLFPRSPTGAPTAEGTAAPTPADATPAPTAVPTAGPTVPPTTEPTAAATTAAPTAAPSDAPSDVPSAAPSSTAGTEAPTGSGYVAPPIEGPCNDLCSDSYGTLENIQAAVAMVDGAGTICLCPTTFTPEAGNCPTGVMDSVPTIRVADGQDVTIECVSPLGAKCIFACPSPVAQVASGGSLVLRGGNNTLLTGGLLYSRIHVDAGATATIEGVAFADTLAGAARRRRTAEDITASGTGGAIHSAGTLTVDQSSFHNCSALLSGGAVYTAGDASITASSFTSNAAQTGGAVYASGTLFLENNAFQGNVATDTGANLAGDAALTGCGNAGLAGSTPCEDTGSGANAVAGAARAGATLLALAATAAVAL